MENEHLENILKIISVDDYDEIIMGYLYVYIRSRKLLELGNDDDSQYDIDKVNALIKNTHLIRRTADSDSPYEYVVVRTSPPRQ